MDMNIAKNLVAYVTTQSDPTIPLVVVSPLACYFTDPTTGARWDIWVVIDPTTGILRPHRLFRIPEYKGGMVDFSKYNCRASVCYDAAEYVCNWLNGQLADYAFVDRMAALDTLLNEKAAA